MIKDYEYLWTTEKDEWCLFYTENGYCIINMINQSALLISDSELENKVIEKMMNEGICTYEDINEVIK